MRASSTLLVLSFTLLAAPLQAGLSLPSFFSEGMVLQRERDAAIWGQADPGARVTVTFQGRSATATADPAGTWRAAIPSGPANATGTTLTVQAGAETVTIPDVLVGEVWFASGQSNMYFTMDRVPAYADLIRATNLPGLRFFNAPLVTAVEPQRDIAGTWISATPETVPGCSAVAFFFARKLHLDLGIPVAVIKSAWGGKPVETFTSREALNTLPGTKALVDALLAEDKVHDPATAQAAYEKNLAAWQAAAAAWKAKPAAERGRLPKKPGPPKRPLDTEGRPGVLYNAMIHPFVGYTMRGAIWYQGEGNAKPDAVPYDQTLPLMIRDWRGRWGDEFSFYYVQLANYRAPSAAPGTPDPWPLLQDRMRLVLATTPKTGMAIINDTGEADDIHPKNKQDPGERLALWALAKDYGKELVAYSGPLYRGAEVRDGAVRVTFDQTGAGLKSRDGGALKRFEIAGSDRVWHWADAKVDGSDAVLVSSAAVPQPVAVRYAWASNPEGANLVNSEGLPASVFRTDDWKDAETVPVDPAAAAAAARRALGVKIRELAARRNALSPDTDEWRRVTAELKALQEQLKASAPAPAR
jgi:sialate O-acetylesterase